jgi:hypothetical protein
MRPEPPQPTENAGYRPAQAALRAEGPAGVPNAFARLELVVSTLADLPL